MRSVGVVVLAVAVVGCGPLKDTTGDGGMAADAGVDAGDAGVVPFMLTAPTEDSTFVRNYLTAANIWVAQIQFTAQGSAVASINWMDSDGNLVGVGLPPTFAFTNRYPMDGDYTITAVALDDNNNTITMASVDFTVTPTPTVTNCAGALDLLGVMYDGGPDTPGITSPITIMMPLNGVLFTPAGGTFPRSSWTMDCNMAVSLWRLSDLFVYYAVTSVVDGGIYDQRPLHSAGLGLDIVGFTTADGQIYDLATNWIPDTLGAGDTACSVLPGMTPKNELLHSFVCEIAADDIFNNNILTPAAGDAHPDHFHFDVMPGATTTPTVKEGLEGD